MAISGPQLRSTDSAVARNGDDPLRVALAPRVGVAAAIRRDWLVVLAAVVVMVAIAAAIGLKRSPVFTATSQLSAGAINISGPGALGGYSTASSSLAATWSRSVDAETVLKPVAAIVHRSTAFLASHVTASPLPQSPIFRVQANAATSARAIQLANLTTASLIGYVSAVGRHDRLRSTLFGRFKTDSDLLARHGASVRAATAALRSGSTAARQQALTTALAARQETQLHFDADRAAYLAADAARASAPQVRLLFDARTAASDRSRKLELILLLGLLAGIALGAAIATVRANRAVRQARALLPA